MPNYEYRCLACKHRFEVYMTYTEYGTKVVNCPKCNSSDISRRIGRIRIAKSEDSRLDDFSDMADLEGLEDDPVAMGRMMRRMSSEMGEEMPAEFDEVVDRLESGQSPDDIERELPDLADDLTGGSAGNALDDE